MQDWTKDEKGIYLPPTSPMVIDVPEFRYFTITGEGNPNSESYAERVAVLYALSYGIKMSPKKGLAPKNYEEYKVYPLEGVWDVIDPAKAYINGAINKDNLKYKIMIRQPDFVAEEFAQEIIELTKKKKPELSFEGASFEIMTDGKCVQMLHVGSYDAEPASFALMEQFAEEQGLQRESKVHKEIYLSDPRRVAAEKLKTVLRFKVY